MVFSRSAQRIGLPSKRSAPCGVMARVGLPFGSLIGGAWVSGRSRSTPRFKSGAVIMKMTSKTSITSTRGVTLISELRSLPPPRLPSIAMRFGLLLQEVPPDDVEVVVLEGLHRGDLDPDAPHEIVVR